MNYVRLVIGECLSSEQVLEFARAFDDAAEEWRREPYLVGLRLIQEAEGTMVIVLTTWETRDACLRFHSSRSYRQFVGKTSHLLVGNVVVKLFDEARSWSKDSAALTSIQSAMSGREWDADTLDMIAGAVHLSGRAILEPTV